MDKEIRPGSEEFYEALFKKARNRRKYDRQREIMRIRKEGRDAFFAGKSTSSCPYRSSSPDEMQWLRGYLNH